MSEKMKITKKTDVGYTVLCLNVAEDIYKVIGHFKGETAEKMADKIETNLVAVASELNINYFTYCRENNHNVKLDDFDFEDISDLVDFKTNIYGVILDFKVFVYGKQWLEAQCKAMEHQYERYGGI